MFFGRSEQKRMNPYVAIAVGALAFVGAVSLVKGARGMIRYGCDKVKCMVRDVMHGECECT